MEQYSTFIEQIVKRNMHIVKEKRAEELYQKRMKIPNQVPDEQ